SAAALSLSPFWVLAATGLAIGPVYPVMIALTARRFPRAIGTASGLAAGAGAIGGFVWPWLAGAIGDALSPRASIALLAGCALLIAIAAFGLAGEGSPPSAAIDEWQT
ncbi:MAG TPA: hypothetical protein VHZ95_19465, partial [Polyangiales bacterium]|nr:hypothetical protein [Polyangiales bacterium]